MTPSLLLLSGAVALSLVSCGGARAPAPKVSSAPAAPSEPAVEVAVAPEATAPEAPSAEATEPSPPKTVFYVNRPFKEDPQLLLTRVTKLPDGLKLDFLFTNKSNGGLMIKVAPAGDANAMFVELLDGRRLEMKSAEGISIKPERDLLQPGDKQRFSLTFEPLPDGVTKFNVYEGAGAKNAPPGQSQFWMFRGVQLK